jgi:succinate dehydrogenase/fumarate reductase flavoprotein subunit
MVEYQLIETDVLVVGAGGAGCRAAMAAADAGARVVLIEKGRLGVTGNTFDPFTWGKGIIVAAEGYNPTDDPDVHYREAIAAARGLANPALVRAVAYDAPDRFRELLDMGLNFIPNQLGTCFGDSMVGAVIDQPSLAQAFKREIGAREIQVLEKTMVIGLLSDGQRCTGAVALTYAGDVLACQAKGVILATGGASPMFRYNLNAPATTGDGHVMALSAEAELTNLEFYQAILGTTQPARVYFPQWYMAGSPPFYNARGHRFLPDYLPTDIDPEGLVAERSFHGPFSFSRPSGWVDIAIYGEIQADRGTAAWEDEKRLAGVYCDFASLPAKSRQELDRREALPALAWLKARGLDYEARPVPVAPFAHAFNGGIVIDENGATEVPGLYACGEVAAGPHGANRLGGHMFALLLVFGARAGRHAAQQAAGMPPPKLDREGLTREIDRIEVLRSRDGKIRPGSVRKRIQRAMSPIMIAKDAAGLEAAIEALTEIKQAEIDRIGLHTQPDLFEAVSVSNLLEIATILAQAALLRRESRGPHYRTDYPEERDDLFGKNLLWKLGKGEYTSRWASLK